MGNFENIIYDARIKATINIDLRDWMQEKFVFKKLRVFYYNYMSTRLNITEYFIYQEKGKWPQVC